MEIRLIACPGSLDRQSRERGCWLVVCVLAFVLADVLFRFFVEGLLATGRAKVIGPSFVLGFTSGSVWINIHTADGIFDCVCHCFLHYLDYLALIFAGRALISLPFDRHFGLSLCWPDLNRKLH